MQPTIRDDNSVLQQHAVAAVQEPQQVVLNRNPQQHPQQRQQQLVLLQQQQHQQQRQQHNQNEHDGGKINHAVQLQAHRQRLPSPTRRPQTKAFNYQELIGEVPCGRRVHVHVIQGSLLVENIFLYLMLPNTYFVQL